MEIHASYHYVLFGGSLLDEKSWENGTSIFLLSIFSASAILCISMAEAAPIKEAPNSPAHSKNLSTIPFSKLKNKMKKRKAKINPDTIIENAIK